ncbi:MAG TPA: NAD-dependent epimerase/dehydratase family protein [Ignavibacteriales bacterium]|nr:NAD-dependent epimerase/dehydratase family protein [Ignavibacteriales bacterium]
MGIKVIITGSTGMVGEGVLFECLEHPDVEKVLMVNRRHYSLTNPKVQEVIIPDFLSLDDFAVSLTGYDACFFCAGISSRGMKEEEYNHITYDITTHFAKKLAELNHEMTFVYVSGAWTDSTEKGKVMWARVKGKTENALMRMPFKRAYNFRPGFMKPFPGQKNIQSIYKPILSLFPILIKLFPNFVLTMREVGIAMINSVLKGYPKQILEVKDIRALAKS